MESLPKTLPASWYRSSPLYQLEKRGVFLKAWFLLAPITRFQGENEVVNYEMAGVKLCVRRTSVLQNDIAVYNAETGEELRSYITESGLLFTTISSMAPSFKEYFPDLEPLLARVDFTELPYRKSIKYEGNFNWKTMVDGYQECLHCQYTHPSFSVLYPPAFYAVHNHTNFSRHIADPTKPDDGLFLYFFPVVTLNVYGGGMSSFRVCPTEDPGVTRMEFDYYHVEEGEKFEEYYKFVRQVALEDFELCEKAQANLEKGIYHEGILNPEKESGVAWYQQEVLKRVVAQHEIEKVASDLAMEAFSQPTSVADIFMQAQEDPPMIAVAISLPLILAAVIFLSRHSLRWSLRLVVPASFHPQPSSEIDSYHASAHEISTSQDVPEGWFTDAKLFSLERRAIFATGKLTKAPKFDGIPGFKREENNLYQIWVKTDDNGFVFINFQGDWSVQDPDTRGLSDFANSSGISPTSTMVDFWQAEGDFNWKLASSLFEASNDHPFVGHEPKPGSLLNRLFGGARHQQKQATCQPSPISALRSIPGTNLWFMTVVEPLSATRSSLRRTLYCTHPNPSSTLTLTTNQNQTLLNAVGKDFNSDLETLIQSQIAMTTTTTANNTPIGLSKTITPSQTHLLERIEEHLRRERKAGTQIFPAAQLVADGEGSGVAEKLCRDLDTLADAGLACRKSGSDARRLAW
ncbi:hypothetical protein BLS_000494 [Venturia inaequalis]|uniref:Choline monooxygenase, chloroplastic n=1 Tax=Venturia inaequalis TaxID=5025 RepID=A0A8H3U2U8_VENIN|nr:hypothetical protein BLS_000494 [Venturia inaequalis]